MGDTQLLSLTIGRARESGIQLEDASVSGLHAIVAVHDGRLLLTDTGSSNGTFVNDKRVERLGRFFCDHTDVKIQKMFGVGARFPASIPGAARTRCRFMAAAPIVGLPDELEI